MVTVRIRDLTNDFLGGLAVDVEGSQALDGPGVVGVLVAVLAFTVLVAAAVVVLFRGSGPSSSPRQTCSACDDPLAIDGMRWSMAENFECRYDQNLPKRRQMATAVSVATAAVGVEVLRWLAAL